MQCQAAAVRQLDCSKFSDPEPRNSCRQVECLFSELWERWRAICQEVSVLYLYRVSLALIASVNSVNLKHRDKQNDTTRYYFTVFWLRWLWLRVSAAIYDEGKPESWHGLNSTSRVSSIVISVSEIDHCNVRWLVRTFEFGRKWMAITHWG